MKKPFIFLFGIVITAGTLLACGESNTGTASSNTASNISKPASTQHFKIGDTVKVGDTWQAVVNSVKTDDGGQYSTLKSGDTYIVIDVSLTNLSSTEQNVSSELNFTLLGTDGQKYTEGIDSNVGATLDGKVAANSPLRGVIVYEVPSTVKQFTFNYAPDITGSGQTTWDLTVS